MIWKLNFNWFAAVVRENVFYSRYFIYQERFAGIDRSLSDVHHHDLRFVAVGINSDLVASFKLLTWKKWMESLMLFEYILAKFNSLISQYFLFSIFILKMQV